MSTAPLSLSDIVNVAVYLAPAAIAAPFPNQGAICGTTLAATGGPTHANRMVQITAAGFPANMLALGYTNSSPETVYATAYFAQQPQPNFLWLGLQDLTSLKTVTPTSPATGSNYTVGDILGVIQGSPVTGSGGQIVVTSVGTGGTVTGISLEVLNDGTGYTVANSVATTNITVANPAASGAFVDITAVGETPLVALENCRAFNQVINGANVPVWYGYCSTTATDSDTEAMAAFAQSAQPVMKLYYSSATAAIPTNATTDVASYCKANNYSRTMIIYSTTQGGYAPNNVAMAAATMGVEMGHNTGLPNSWFDMFSQTLVGMITEPINQNQANYITGKNANFYGSFGPFPLFYDGIMSNGVDSSIILFSDVLVYQLQYNIMNDIKENGPYTMDDPGEQRAIHQANLGCQYVGSLGALSAGEWTGASFAPPISLVAGQYIPNGYLAQAYPMAQLSASARAARQLQPIILAVIMTEGAISVSIGLYVQQS